MSRLYLLNESLAARRQFPVFLVDGVDGITAEDGENGGQPQISKAGGAFANTQNTLVFLSDGAYTLDLGTDVDTLGQFTIRYKSANTAEFNMDGQVS